MTHILADSILVKEKNYLFNMTKAPFQMTHSQNFIHNQYLLSNIKKIYSPPKLCIHVYMYTWQYFLWDHLLR